MLFVAGRRTNTQTLGRVTRVCAQCKRDTLHTLFTTGTQATMFFVPVATYGKKTFLQCTVCGYGYDLSSENAAALATNPSLLDTAVAQKPIMVVGMNTAATESSLAPSAPAQFYAPNIALYIVATTLTAGLFNWYWAWRNWRFLGALQNKKYSAIWRSLLYPIFLYSLTTQTYAAAEKKGYSPAVPTWVPLLIYLGSYGVVSQIPADNDTRSLALMLLTATSAIPLLLAMKFYNEKK